MKCECGGNTQVSDTRLIDDMCRRRRKCEACGESFFTKEVFLYKAEDNPNAIHNRKRKDLFTKPEAAAVKFKKVEARRKAEDIKERKLRVPSYFIEEDY